MDEAVRDQVRQRAYQIWVDLGRVEGRAHEHWVAAEQDVTTATPLKMKRATSAKAAPAKKAGAAKKVGAAKATGRNRGASATASDGLNA